MPQRGFYFLGGKKGIMVMTDISEFWIRFSIGAVTLVFIRIS